MFPKYEEDFYGWAMNNAELIRQRRLNELDFDNLIEEIESMGRSEKNQFLNRLIILMAHLLKWHYQPGLRGNSWKYTIKEQRKKLDKHLRENPSLKSKLMDISKEAYEYAILEAACETGLEEESFPQECPYTFEQCLDDQFYPK